MTMTESERRQQFKASMRTIHRELEHRFPGRDLTSLEHVIEQHAEALYAQSLSLVTPFDPIKQYKKESRRLLREILQPEIDRITTEMEIERQKQLESVMAELELFLGRIDAIIADLKENKLPRPRPCRDDVHWRGADVILSDHPLDDYRGSHTLVVTKYAGYLTSLFFLFRDSDPGALCYLSKYEFYGSMAEAVNFHLKSDSDPMAKELLQSAASAAREVVQTWIKRMQKDLT